MPIFEAQEQRDASPPPYWGYLPDGGAYAFVDKVIHSLPPNYCLTLPDMRLLLAEYALKLLFSARKISGQREGSLLYFYTTGKYLLGPYAPLIDDLVGDILPSGEKVGQLLPALSLPLSYRSGIDVLGLLYRSLQSLIYKEKKRCCVSHEVSNQMVRALMRHMNTEKMTVCDPACATGNFLLLFASLGRDPHELFGQDSDALSVQLARISLVCTCEIDDLSLLYRNITCADSLTYLPKKQYDVLVCAPPWKKHLSDDLCPPALFLAQGIRHLSQGGILSFFLPRDVLCTPLYHTLNADIQAKGGSVLAEDVDACVPACSSAMVLTVNNAPLQY